MVFTKKKRHLSRHTVSRIALMGLIALWPATSLATTDVTTTFLVSATVLDICGVVATPLAFGNYSATSVSPTTATSTITVICTTGLDYTIALNEGTTSGSTVDARAMTDGTHTLDYGLYTDSDYNTIWGDGTASTSTVSGSGTGIAQIKTVYGQIPTAQYVASGAYTDTVTVTVTY